MYFTATLYEYFMSQLKFFLTQISFRELHLQTKKMLMEIFWSVCVSTKWRCVWLAGVLSPGSEGLQQKVKGQILKKCWGVDSLSESCKLSAADIRLQT